MIAAAPTSPPHSPSARLLPRAVQEEALREALHDWLDRADWFCFVQGKARCGRRRRRRRRLCHRRRCVRVPLAAPLPSHRCCRRPPPCCSAKEVTHSRAYLRFRDAADVPRFQQAFDAHAWVSERGTQFRCVRAAAGGGGLSGHSGACCQARPGPRPILPLHAL